MKKILFLVVFVIISGTSISQTMVLKRANGAIDYVQLNNTVEITFSTLNSCQIITTVLHGGKTYNTVQIGTQCWLKENLNIGTRITGSSNQTDNNTIEKYCYDNLETNCDTYGGLYQWAEAVQYKNGATNTTSPSPAFAGNVQGICPSGWHIPTQAEFQTLSTTVNNIGNKLLAVGEGTGAGAGTNTSGFSGLLAGYCYAYNGSFYNIRSYAYFWNSTESNATTADYLILFGNSSDFYIYNDSKINNGFSVRCLKD